MQEFAINKKCCSLILQKHKSRSLIKYKTLTFDSTFEGKQSTLIYDFSNDEDLKDAEIIGLIPIGISLYNYIAWWFYTVDTINKKVYFAIEQGQRVSGVYSILYK